MPLGNHHWTFKDDINCYEGKPVEISVSLALCQPADFNCDDGGCVDLSSKCDGQNDCGDGSDELNCKIVQLPTNYNNQLCPVDDSTSGFTTVNISFAVIDMLDIDEKTGKMRVKFLLGTTWNDLRLVFLDLWEEFPMNTLTKAEMDSVWYPLIQYNNAELALFDYNIKAEISVMLNESASNFSYAPPNQLYKAQMYQGSLNSLYWRATIR